MSKRAEKKYRLYNEIIDAAQSVFFEKGYQIATMDDICANANISKRTLYMYFTGKDQLIMAVLDRGFDLLVSHYQVIEEKDPLQRLEWIIRNFIQFSFNEPDYFMLIAQFENQREDFNQNQDPLVKSVYQKANFMINVLLDCVKDGIDQKVLTQRYDPVNATIILWSSLFGLCSTLIKKRHYMKFELNRSAEDMIEDTLKMIRYALIK
jgi:AcrR family transcriptional regulator